MKIRRIGPLSIQEFPGLLIRCHLILFLVLCAPGSLLGQTTTTYNDGDTSAAAIDTSAPNDPTTLSISGGSATQSGVISGTGGLTKTGSGSLTLSGANTYTGETIVSGGTLVLGNADAAGVGGNLRVNAILDLGSLNINKFSVIVQNGTVENGTLNAGGAIQMQNATIDAVIAGTGYLRSLGAGTSTLSAVNTYTGATVVDDGTVSITSTGSILTTSGITINGGTLSVDGAGGNAIADTMAITNTSGSFTLTGSDETIGSISGAGDINLEDNTLTTGGDGTSTTVSGVISGAGGGLTKAGAGTLTLSGSNTYTGATTINAGTLTASNSTALGNNSAVTVSGGGTLNLTTDLSIGSLAGSGAVTMNANTLTAGGDNTSTSFSGIISGIGGFTKTGSGSLTLSGANTYTGETIVSGGTLVLGNAGAAGVGGNLRVTGNSTLDLGSLSINKFSIIVQNGTVENGTLNASGAIQTGGAAIGATIDAVIAGTGYLSNFGGTTTLSAVNTYTGATVVDDGTVSITSTGSILTTSGITINGGTLSVDGAGGNAIADTMAITNNTSGSFTLTGSDETIGSISGAGDINLEDNTLTTGGDGTSTTVSGVISGAGGGLTKAGAGTLTLSGSNTYTGATTINTGTLTASNSTALGNNSAVTVSGGGTLNLTTDLSIGSLAGSGAVTMNANTLTAGGDGTSTSFAGIISGTGGFTKTGAGSLTLSGANTYTGETTVSGGTLVLGNADAAGVGGNLRVQGGSILDLGSLNLNKSSVIVQNGTIENGTLNTSGTIQMQNATINAVIAGTGYLSSVGAGTSTLSGVNTYTGVTEVGGGTLSITSTGSILTTSGITINGGTLSVDGAGGNAVADTMAITNTSGSFTLTGSDETIGSISGAGDINLEDNTLTTGGDGTSTTVSGVISGAGGGLTKAGAGTLTLSGSNTYSGATTINAGTLTASNSTALGNNSAVTVSGAGTLNLTTDLSIGSLAGSGAVTMNANTLTAGGDNASTSFSGIISGTGGFTKTGSGITTLTGANSYTGGTNLTAGTFVIGNNAAFGTGNLTIGDGTNLGGTGAFRITNDIAINGDFSVAPRNTLPSISSLELDGDVALGSSTRTITNTLDFSNFEFGQVNFGGVISGGSGTGLTLADNGSTPGANVVFFRFDGTGANTYSGDTTIGSNVSLSLEKTAGVNAIAGDVEVNSEAVVAIVNSEQIANSSTVTLNGTGRLQIGIDSAVPVTETISSLNDDGSGSGVVELAGNGSTGSNLVVSNGNFSGEINGGGANSVSLIKTGTGTLTLSGANTYLGGTTVSAGKLLGNNLTGSATGNGAVQVMNGATLGGFGNFAGDVTIENGGRLSPGNSPGTLTTGNLTLNAGSQLDYELDSPGIVGSGINDLVLVNGNLVLDGILNIADLGSFGVGDYRLFDYTGGLTDNGLLFGVMPGLFDLTVDTSTINEVNLSVAAATSQFWNGSNTSPNGLINGGTSTWDAATSNWTNTGGNASSAWAGGLTAVFSGTPGTVTIANGFSADPKALDFRTGGYTLEAAGTGQLSLANPTGISTTIGTTIISAPVTGNGGITKLGAGILELTGANTYLGSTTVSAGKLLGNNLTGSATGNGAVQVMNGATLGGFGNFAGDVTIENGGRLSPGNSPGTLTTGNLTLSATSQLDYELDSPGIVGSGVNDLVVVNGNLVLDGILNITDLGSFGTGEYRLFDYTGGLTDNGLLFGVMPGLFDLTVDTSTINEVNLSVAAATSQFWNGSNTSPNGLINGGTSTWDAATSNWTNTGGNASSGWAGGLTAVFSGTPGTVTIANGFSADPNALDFRTGGYTLEAAGTGKLSLANPTGITTAIGTTVISAPVTGNGGITKLGAGSLELTGANTYTGGTTVDDGNLVIGDAGSIVNSSGVNVYGGASLTLSNDDQLGDGIILSLNNDNTGGSFLNLGGNETIMAFTDNGSSTIGGVGTLTANEINFNSTTTLTDTVVVSTNTINSRGQSKLNGNTTSTTFNVNGGTVTLGDNNKTTANDLNIASGGTLNATKGLLDADTIDLLGTPATPNAKIFLSDNDTYNVLRGNGTINPTGATFTNNVILAAGDANGTSAIGQIITGGNYVENGNLVIDFDPLTSTADNIRANGGTVTLTSGSVLNPYDISGGNVMGIGQRINIINTGGTVISGGFGEITDGNNTGPSGSTDPNQFFFDVGTGNIVGLGLINNQGPDNYGGTSNQTKLITALTDAAIDTAGNYNSADGGAGTTLDLLYGGSTTVGPITSVQLLAGLNELSPAGYAGVLDYTLQSTRSYVRNATRTYAPSDAGVRRVPVGYSSAEPEAPLMLVSSGMERDVFAGFSQLDVSADSNVVGEDYRLRSYGGYTGLRISPSAAYQLGFFLAVDEGSVDATGLNLDTDGVVFGAFGRYDQGSFYTIASASLAQYEISGQRNVLGSSLRVPGHDADAFQLGIETGYTVYDRPDFQITPKIGLQYLSADVDGFTETGGPGALTVASQGEDSLLMDMGVLFTYAPKMQRWGLEGEIGWEHDFNDTSRPVSANFGAGGAAFTVISPGLGEDALFMGLRGHYDLTESLRFGAGYRGELRDESNVLHSIDARFTCTF
ncbi:autotransporter-associated beta strand repeat-containing protein [Luteolibacter sp. AS25]|uniref:autotransporter-associated beta strand repeat-containing protein n=1 Tax=Luteolibacter sp. AS25 TaxID=3135776 RepID=UPI00398ACE06